MQNRNKNKAVFWGLAAVYLMYSIYKLLSNYGNTVGRERYVVIGVSIIFAAFCIYLVINIVRVLKGNSGTNSQDDIKKDSDMDKKGV